MTDLSSKPARSAQNRELAFEHPSCHFHEARSTNKACQIILVPGKTAEAEGK